METYARFLVRRAWPVLIAVTLLTLWIGSGIRHLRSEFTVEANLPAHHPLIEIDQQIRRRFGGRNTVIGLIVPRQGDVWRPEVLEVVQQATFAALHLEGVMAQNVVSLAAPSVRVVDDTGDRLEVNYLMRDVPRTAEAIAALRARVDADPQFRGLLVTPDQRGAALVIDFWDGNASADIAQRVLGLRDQFRDRPVDIYFAGEPIVSLTDVEQAREMAARIPIAFAVIAAMLLVSFRNLQGMVIPMLTAVLSTVWGLGLMGHTGLAMNTWNIATPVLLIAVAAGHSAQMLKRYIEEVERLGDNRAAVISSTAAMGPVMIAAGGVAALGFAALALTGIPAITGFGLACAYGIASVVVLEMTFVPALRSLLPAPRPMRRRRGPVQRVLDGLERAIQRRGGRAVLIGTGVALVLAAGGAAQIRTYGSTREYMPHGSIPRDHLEQIEQHLPATVTMTVLYEGPPESAKSLAELRHLDGLRAEIEADPLVWRTASLVDLVKTLHRTFNPDAPDSYRLPDTQELLSQLMFLGDSPAFERFIDREYAHSLLVAYLRDDDSARVGPLVERARAWVAAHPPPDGVQVLIAGGTGPTILAVNEHTTHTKVLNILLVLAAIYLVSSLVLRSPLGGLYVILPIAASMVLLFGLLGWLGIRLDMGSASVLAIAAGIGADYAIYFLYRLREEWSRSHDADAALHTAMQTSGRAVVFVAASIGAGFGAIGLFSRFFGLRLFGALMPLAMAVSCIAALSLMPVLVLRTRPAFIFGRARRPRTDGAHGPQAADAAEVSPANSRL